MKHNRLLFFISIVLYLLVRLSRFNGVKIPAIINSYLTDFLCLPIILYLSLIGVQKIKNIPNYRLTVYQIFGMTLFYAILFEWYLPSRSYLYTRDYYDVIAYFVGALFFFILQSKSVEKV